jgi:hypothetical protein
VKTKGKKFNFVDLMCSNRWKVVCGSNICEYGSIFKTSKRNHNNFFPSFIRKNEKLNSLNSFFFIGAICLWAIEEEEEKDGEEGDYPMGVCLPPGAVV